MKYFLFLFIFISCTHQTRNPASTSFPEAIIKAPISDKNSTTFNDIPMGHIRSDYQVDIDDQDRVVGFKFTNSGANSIIPFKPKDYGTGPGRDFGFTQEGQARQDLHMSLTDVPSEFLSELMESYLYFFPRNNLFAIKIDGENLVVTIPTGEEIIFDRNQKTIKSGVIKENGAIDLNPSKYNRKFANITYSGSGIMIRANKRGNDPRIGNIVEISKGLKKCKVQSSLLWEQSGKIHFHFASDEEFYRFLSKQCPTL